MSNTFGTVMMVVGVALVIVAFAIKRHDTINAYETINLKCSEYCMCQCYNQGNCMEVCE